MFQTLGVEQSILQHCLWDIAFKNGLFLRSNKSFTYCNSYLFKLSSLLIPLLIGGHVSTLFTSVKVVRAQVLRERGWTRFWKRALDRVQREPRVLELQGWKSNVWLMSQNFSRHLRWSACHIAVSAHHYLNCLLNITTYI